MCKNLEAYEPRITDMEVCLLDRLENQVESSRLITRSYWPRRRISKTNLAKIIYASLVCQKGSEGRTVVAFMSKFFVDLLQDGLFNTPARAGQGTKDIES